MISTGAYRYCSPARKEVETVVLVHPLLHRWKWILLVSCTERVEIRTSSHESFESVYRFHDFAPHPHPLTLKLSKRLPIDACFTYFDAPGDSAVERDMTRLPPARASSVPRLTERM